jgi:ubiquinone biosynthesis protein UbiJ
MTGAKISITDSIPHMFPPNTKAELFHEEVKRLENEADRLHPSKIETENAWSFAST